MLRSVYISKPLSGLLLVLFALSITPKNVLHSIFANHIDVRINSKSNSPSQLTPTGFNCDTENFVAESAFVNTQAYFDFPILISFSSYISKNVSFSSIDGVYSQFRGPPVKVS